MGRQNHALLIDLDGVLYQENDLIAGGLETMHWIEEQNIDYLFVTNTTSKSRALLENKIRQMGFSVDLRRIITPVVASSKWLHEKKLKSVALFVKSDACIDFSGIEAIDMENESVAEAIIIGDLGDSWDYSTLNCAFRLLMQAPKPVLIALGMTRFWRSHDGLSLDVAPFVKALEHAADCTAEIIGKPSRSFYDSALSLLGYSADSVVMIGDDIVGDVEAAQNSGIRGLLVRTGKFRKQDLESTIKPDAVLDSFADLPAWWIENISANG